MKLLRVWKTTMAQVSLCRSLGSLDGFSFDWSQDQYQTFETNVCMSSSNVMSSTEDLVKTQIIMWTFES